MSENVRVGFIGLGSQGGPMARRIVQAGFETTLWARRPESVAPYADTSATVASTLRRLGEASDILGVCVTADADVESVLTGADGALAGLRPGSIVMIHSTVHPETCRRLQREHPGVHFLDAPVSGGGHLAAVCELLVMVGGEPEVLERCRPVLETFGNPVVHLGALGAGQEAKLLNNALFTAQLGLVADVFAQGTTRGLDPAALAGVLAKGSARSYAAEVISNAGYSIDVMAQLAGDLLAKDVAIIAALLDGTPHLVSTADVTLAAMGIERPAPASDHRDD